MTKEALGKGRAAIFEGLNQPQATIDKLPVTSSQLPVTDVKAEASDHRQDTSSQPPVTSGKIDESILDQALAEAKESPKITVFSPKVAAVLRYKQLTTIRYSFSTEAREKLEQTIKDAYPELYEAVEKALAKK
jgi:membrane-bound lytic murein transglycosylase B